MREKERSSGNMLRTWHAMVADGIALLWFFSANQPLALKIGVAALAVAGAHTIVIFNFGRHRGRAQLSPRVRELEVKNRRLQKERDRAISRLGRHGRDLLDRQKAA